MFKLFLCTGAVLVGLTACSAQPSGAGIAAPPAAGSATPRATTSADRAGGLGGGELGASAAPAIGVTGLWDGTYTCAQGLTGLTLAITVKPDASAEAIFDFYAVPANRGVPTGSYTMVGTYTDAAGLALDGRDWLIRPAGYVIVNLRGALHDDGATLSGTVTGAGSACTTFTLKRSVASPSPSAP